jgi:hypothetical protein
MGLSLLLVGSVLGVVVRGVGGGVVSAEKLLTKKDKI